MYRGHRRGSGGPPGGATSPGGPYGLYEEGIQPKVGWGATPLGPMRLGLGETLRGGAPLLGGQAPLPLAAVPPLDPSRGGRPPSSFPYK